MHLSATMVAHRVREVFRFRRLPLGPVGSLAAAGWLAVGATAAVGSGEPVPVRHIEGTLHGFLALRTLDGGTIASGDLVQLVDGPRVTSRLTFEFRDGSLHDETTVFSQRGHFRLISDHLVQRGPSFPHPLEMWITAETGVAKVRYTDKGSVKERTDTFAVQPDLANGLILTLLKNIKPDAPPKALPFVAATPTPRVVTLAITPAGQEKFSVAGRSRAAQRYAVHVNIGGLSGLLARVAGKQPPDSRVWILPGDAPAFVKAEQPLYPDGPVWRIELIGPTW